MIGVLGQTAEDCIQTGLHVSDRYPPFNLLTQQHPERPAGLGSHNIVHGVLTVFEKRGRPRARLDALTDLMVEAGCCGQADACKARPLFSFVEEPMMMLLEFWVAG